jgi:Apc13p protein
VTLWNMSDSSYVAVTQHRRPFSTTGRPPVLELVDDAWAADSLSDDEIETSRQELTLAPLLEEDEMDADTVVVTTGNSASAANSAAERRRREEGWTDLALDQFLEPTPVVTVPVSTPAASSSGGGNAQ